MKTLMTLVISLAALALCGTTLADPVPPDGGNPADVPQTSRQRAAQAIRNAPLFHADFAMSSGLALRVLSGGLCMRIRYGGPHAMKLRYDGQGAYVSDDGRVTLVFEMDDLDQPTVQSLRLPAGESDARGFGQGWASLDTAR